MHDIRGPTTAASVSAATRTPGTDARRAFLIFRLFRPLRQDNNVYNNNITLCINVTRTHFIGSRFYRGVYIYMFMRIMYILQLYKTSWTKTTFAVCGGDGYKNEQKY